MNCNKRYSITKYISGSCWIIAGILGYCNGSVTDIIRIAFLALLVGVLIYQTRIKSANPKQEAAYTTKDFARTAICCVFCAAAVLVFIITLLFDENNWNWPFIVMHTFSIILGLFDIGTGVSFGKLKRRENCKSHQCSQTKDLGRRYDG